MNCQSFTEIVSELARDRDPDPIEAGLRASVLDHLDGCAECHLKLQDQRVLSRGLQELAREMESLGASPRVEEQLLMAFRQECQGSEVRRLRSEIIGQRSALKGRRVFAAAAVVLIVLGIASLSRVLNRRGQSVTPHTNVTIAESPANPLPLPVNLSGAGAPKMQSTDPTKAVTQKNSRRHSPSVNRDRNANRTAPENATSASVNDMNSEVATYFMPLGYAGPISPDDGGQLVRVELSRSAMLSMGLPVNMDRYGERVKADVLLGPDGLARAIRFVQ